MKVKFDANLMKTISIFESISHAHVKDCIEQGNVLIFVVNKGEMSKAIGPKGNNVRRIEQMFKKKIKIIEFNEDVIEFVKNVVMPIKVVDVTEEEDVIIITPVDSPSRGLLIGRGAINLRGFEEIVKRYFPIKEMKVV